MTVAVNHSFCCTDDQAGPVITRVTALDPYKGLKGHDYIKARNLNKPVQRVQTSAQTDLASTCHEVCK